MANEEQLSILRKGIESWNVWRNERPDIRVDLCGADFRLNSLTGANLANVDFQAANFNAAILDGAILDRSNFHSANLRLANLRQARLFGTILDHANLQEADLSWSNLSAASLANANLTSANLSGTNLCNTTLRGADLTDCLLGWTQFDSVDLSSTKGLESVHHLEPSIISIDTLYISNGQISEEFLRRAGVPEPFITNMKALIAAMEPVQRYSCFISYSSKDQDFAERLYTDLINKGVRCWFAPESLKIGDKLRPSFNEAIRLHDKLMVILSESSIASPWVEKEVETAFEKERKQHRTVLFPIRVDDAVMETQQAWAVDIRTRHIGDFRAWKNHDLYRKVFDRLLRDLRAEDITKPERS